MKLRKLLAATVAGALASTAMIAMASAGTLAINATTEEKFAGIRVTVEGTFPTANANAMGFTAPYSLSALDAADDIVFNHDLEENKDGTDAIGAEYNEEFVKIEDGPFLTTDGECPSGSVIKEVTGATLKFDKLTGKFKVELTLDFTYTDANDDIVGQLTAKEIEALGIKVDPSKLNVYFTDKEGEALPAIHGDNGYSYNCGNWYENYVPATVTVADATVMVPWNKITLADKALIKTSGAKVVVTLDKAPNGPVNYITYKVNGTGDQKVVTFDGNKATISFKGSELWDDAYGTFILESIKFGALTGPTNGATVAKAELVWGDNAVVNPPVTYPVTLTGAKQAVKDYAAGNISLGEAKTAVKAYANG